MTVFIVVIVIGLLLAIGSIAVKKQKSKETRLRLARQFTLDESYVSDEDCSLVGLNFNRQKIVLGSNGSEAEYTWQQLASIELIENGATLHRTNRGSQLASAFVGGALLGGVGAVIGGLSGSSRSTNRIQGLSLKVIVDDRARPVHIVTFFKSISKNGVSPGSPVVHKAREQAERFHAHLVNAMRTVQSAQFQPAQTQIASPAEIQQLWDMKETGVLTDDEFQSAKQRMLSEGASVVRNDHATSGANSDLRYAVVLRSASNKIASIKALRDMTPGLKLIEAKQIVDSVPTVFKRDLSEDEAQRLRGILGAQGMSASVETEREVAMGLVGIASNPVTANNKSKALTVVVVLILMIFGAVWVDRALSKLDPPNASSAATALPVADSPTAGAISVSATKLYRDYDRNEISADSVYKGRTLLVKGTVQSIDKDFTDSAVLMLATPNEFMGLHAGLRDGEAQKAAQLGKGDTVSLLCKGEGKIVGSPVVDDCVIQ